MKVIYLVVFLLVFVVGGLCFAETASPRDRYYDGLSGIIEDNIDDPQRCVAGVESFLNRNQKLIDDMIKAQIVDLESPPEYVPVKAEDVKVTPQASFNRAMAEFSKQYPQAGEKIMVLNIRALMLPIKDSR